MPRLTLAHNICMQCHKIIFRRTHCDTKFCEKECQRKFDNAINNPASALRKKIHAEFIQRYGERSAELFESFRKNDQALRKIIRYLDFGFLPVPRLVLAKHGYDFDRYSSTEVNLRTDGRIYWTYSLGIEVGADTENVIIRFRNSDGSLRQMGKV